jgi:hypothetical protein
LLDYKHVGGFMSYSNQCQIISSDQVSGLSQQPVPHYARLLCAPVHTDVKVRMTTSNTNAMGERNEGSMNLYKVVTNHNDIINTIEQHAAKMAENHSKKRIPKCVLGQKHLQTTSRTYKATFTCPRLAAAIGCFSNCANNTSTGRPSSFSMKAIAFSAENAGTRSCTNNHHSLSVVLTLANSLVMILMNRFLCLF